MKKTHIFASATTVCACLAVSAVVATGFGINHSDIFAQDEEPAQVVEDATYDWGADIQQKHQEGFEQVVALGKENEARRIAEEEELARLAAEAEAMGYYDYDPSYSGGGYSVGSDFFRDGVWYDGNYRYTYYSSRVLHHYRTSEWTAGADNIYRDSDGYVVVASSDHPQGTVITGTPFGDVKVYDSGCASGTLDVYTNY